MPEQPPLLELEAKSGSTVEDLLRIAEDASAAIEAAELEFLDAAGWIRDQRWRMERLETQTQVKVNAAKVDPDDPESKPLYTNDAMRKAEVSRRLSEDPSHKELMAALNVAEAEQQVRRIHIEKLTRDYQLARLAVEAIFVGKRYAA